MENPRPLNRNQKRFVSAYVATSPRNGQKAYQQVYNVGPEVANAAASRLLADVRIRAAVEEHERAQAEAANLSAERVLAELALIAFSDIGDVMDFSGVSPRLREASAIPVTARRAISSVKVKRYFEGKGEDATEVEVTEFRFWSKDAALEKLGKHFGLFPERITIEDPSKLTDEELDRREAEARQKLRLIA